MQRGVSRWRNGLRAALQFLVNTGNANATDLENLGNLVQKKVQDATGIELEWEIKLLGIHKYTNLNSENVKL